MKLRFIVHALVVCSICALGMGCASMQGLSSADFQREASYLPFLVVTHVSGNTRNCGLVAAVWPNGRVIRAKDLGHLAGPEEEGDLAPANLWAVSRVLRCDGMFAGSGESINAGGSCDVYHVRTRGRVLGSLYVPTSSAHYFIEFLLSLPIENARVCEVSYAVSFPREWVMPAR